MGMIAPEIIEYWALCLISHYSKLKMARVEFHTKHSKFDLIA